MFAKQLLTLAMLAFTTTSLFADEVSEARRRRLVSPNPFYGTSVKVISRYEFVPELRGSVATPMAGSALGVWSTDPALALIAPLEIPHGALLVGWTLDACHANPDGGVIAFIEGWNDDQQVSVGEIGRIYHEGFGMTCGKVSELFQPFAVNNVNTTYRILVGNKLTTGADQLRSVRIFYRPAVAATTDTSFSDVPADHPFHRFIEALHAVGATGGCGDGKYCPDDAVTRGQLATILSAAIGLNYVRDDAYHAESAAE